MRYGLLIPLAPFIAIGLVCGFVYWGIAIGIQLVGEMKPVLFPGNRPE